MKKENHKCQEKIIESGWDHLWKPVNIQPEGVDTR